MRLLLAFLLGIAVSLPWQAEAVRLAKPPTLADASPSALALLNTWLEDLWQLTNGRFTVDVTTTSPNGSRVGTQGDIVFYNNGGNYKLCVNTSSTTPTSPTGTTWRCSANALTAP